jgi:hypothetical protein
MNREKVKTDQWNGSDELHTALKSCREIGSTKTLYQFIMDIPAANSRAQTQIKDFPQFADFLKSVIVCTEQNYNEQELQKVIALPYTKKEKLLDILKSILLELIQAKKTSYL